VDGRRKLMFTERAVKAASRMMVQRGRLGCCNPLLTHSRYIWDRSAVVPETENSVFPLEIVCIDSDFSGCELPQLFSFPDSVEHFLSSLLLIYFAYNRPFDSFTSLNYNFKTVEFVFLAHSISYLYSIKFFVIMQFTGHLAHLAVALATRIYSHII
jgi:hypothetical protein